MLNWEPIQTDADKYSSIIWVEAVFLDCGACTPLFHHNDGSVEFPCEAGSINTAQQFGSVYQMFQWLRAKAILPTTHLSDWYSYAKQLENSTQRVRSL